MQFKKSDWVRARGFVDSGKLLLKQHECGRIIRTPEGAHGQLPGDVRVLMRYNHDFVGIVVGSSIRKIGVVEPFGPFEIDGVEERELVNVENIPVVMVQPTHTQRWLQPRACLAEDLTLVEGGE